MVNVRIEKECGCFKRSGMPSVKTFETKEAALAEAHEWAEEMNETFCKKHNFSVIEEGDDLVLKVAMN
ncbi:MAG: hypothetical protein WA080_04750 [Sulfuricurvum sp.]